MHRGAVDAGARERHQRRLVKVGPPILKALTRLRCRPGLVPPAAIANSVDSATSRPAETASIGLIILMILGGVLRLLWSEPATGIERMSYTATGFGHEPCSSVWSLWGELPRLTRSCRVVAT
jgi:hypothetical protein